MRFKDIAESVTASGSVASVSTPIGATQTRGKGVYPNQKGGNLLTGKKTNKKYANSLKESANVNEEELQEDDLILVPGQGHRLKSGFVPHGQSRVDHEVEMARSDLFSAAKNARQVYELIKDRSEDEGLEGWVQEKIIKANDYLNSVREYLEGKKMQEAGVIAAGGVGESQLDERASQIPTHRTLHDMSNGNVKIPAGSEFRQVEGSNKLFVHLVNGSPKGLYRMDINMLEPIDMKRVTEGAKVDRMVKHIAKSEREAGKSKDEAENIAWATVNKRGYLDNKNKKKGK